MAKEKEKNKQTITQKEPVKQGDKFLCPSCRVEVPVKQVCPTCGKEIDWSRI